jgi:ubiquinone/menaquinone biosynthesis C-methylase UbiE
MNQPVVAARTYARWRATTLGSITERVETKVVFDLTGVLRDKRVLDVGTGDGTYAIEAAARGAMVTALDPEQELLHAARARAVSRGVDVALQRGRTEELPFDDGSFDVVIAVTVLCFVPDAEIAVREMARVLVPGGRLVLGELGRFSLWAAERRVRGWLGSRSWRRARFWSRAEIEGLARAAGLRGADVRGAVFFPPSGLAARLVAPVEPLLTGFHAPGAAFLALAADKPERRS